MAERWTSQEDNQLLYRVGFELPTAIAERLDRSVGGVIRRYKYHHNGSLVRATANAGELGTIDCADALGVRQDRVAFWIRAGWLRAQRRMVHRRWIYTVQTEDFETFIRERGALLNKLRPSYAWIDIVEGARRELRATYINSAELAALFCLCRSVFAWKRAQRELGFPPPAFSLRGRERWYKRECIKQWLAQAPAHYRTPRALRAFGLEDHHGKPRSDQRHER